MDNGGCNIFNCEDFTRLTEGLQIAQCMTREKRDLPDEASILRQLEELVVSDAHSCSCCAVHFPNTSAQRAHFKLDWHRYNLKRQLAGLSTIREEAFDSLADKDDIDSISGSESESEKEEDGKDSDSKGGLQAQPVTRHAKVFLRNNLGQIISLYRCLLFANKETPDTDSQIVNLAQGASTRDTWGIIMLGGGHFAAAIFKGMEPLVHKTFHCYTVRAKQGGSQSSRDNRGGGHPKSAGASLRRYNEQALVQHVQDLISTWTEHIAACHLLFYRAVGPHNRSVLFGGKLPPLDKNDPRLRTIPFPTRRATFSEVKRVHSVLAKLEIHGQEDDFQSKFPLSPPRRFNGVKDEVTENTSNITTSQSDAGSPRRSKGKGKNKPNRAKSRPSPQRPLPAALAKTSSESDAVSGSEMEMRYETVYLSQGDNWKEYEDSVQNEPKKSKKKNKPEKQLKEVDSRTEEDKEKERIKQLEDEKKKKIAEKKAMKAAAKAAAAALNKQLEEEEVARNPTLVFHRQLLKAVQSGDSTELSYCLSGECLAKLPADLPGGLAQSLSLPLAEGNTALHIAAKAGHTEMISILLGAGAHPSTWNKKSQPAYVVATSKETRKAFRDFLVENPDIYDYSGSQIPTPLSEQQEQEIAEKKAAVKKAKRDKEREKRQTQLEQKKEDEERMRFLSLSDREKRALAAERRLLAAQARGTNTAPPILARCFFCAVDITACVPFEYNELRFCSPDCLKGHRLKLKLESVEGNVKK